MKTLLNHKHFDTYLSLLDVDIHRFVKEIKEKEWTIENFKFYTAVSVMSSSKIEGEQLEVDSYVKHKLLQIEYLPELTEKPNDLYKAYLFAKDTKLTVVSQFEFYFNWVDNASDKLPQKPFMSFGKIKQH